MQNRPQGWLYLTAFAALGAGCAVTTTTERTRAARLPTGMTLLESDRSRMRRVGDDRRKPRSRARDAADLVIQRGQNATFEMDADADEDVEIGWTCVGSPKRSATPPSVPTKRRTCASHAPRRVNEFLLECYGDTDGSSSRRARR